MHEHLRSCAAVAKYAFELCTSCARAQRGRISLSSVILCPEAGCECGVATDDRMIPPPALRLGQPGQPGSHLSRELN